MDKHSLRRQDSILNSQLRKRIEEKARAFGYLNETDNLTDINAIRFLQQKEGYTPCFGREFPLRPSTIDANKCAIQDCFWLYACNGYRNTTVKMMDAEFIDKSQKDFETLRRRLIGFEGVSLSADTIGLKLRSFQSISAATRKMLIAAPKTMVGEELEGVLTSKPYLIESLNATWGTSGGMNINYINTILFTSSIRGLADWLRDAEKFLDSGNLNYYPLVKTVEGGGGYSRGEWATNSRVLWTVPEVTTLETFAAPHLGLPDGEIMLTDSEFAPLLNINLPVLEEINLDMLFQLMSDHPEELCSLRDFLLSSVEELRIAAVGSTEFARDCRRIERNIREHLRKVDSDYKKARLATAFALTGCAVATWTLALYCITQGTDNLLTVLGPGGAAFTASAAYSDYLTKLLGLKENPVYFLWMLGKSRRRS